MEDLKERNKNKQNSQKVFLALITVILFIPGCIGFKSVEQKIEDPRERWKIEEQLKTGKDREYWDSVKDHYKNNVIIIIDDTE